VIERVAGPSRNRSVAGRPEQGDVRLADALGYARVSTAGQDLEVQRRRLRDEAKAVRIFEDVISGRSFERPGLAALLDYARPGDVVCVVRLDRLGRSLKQLLETVENFKARGLGFCSLEERLNTSSAAGELVFHVFGAIAHFERRLIVERTRDGIAAARARGSRPGRPALDEAKLQAALTLVRSGLSPSHAARQVGLGRSTLYRELALIPDPPPQPA
jgi:DNA invertase Pin-like site-specific DNA recombinase